MGKVVAIIGGGGKTTSMCALANHLKAQRVLMTTTTHILPVSPPASRELLIAPEEDQLLSSLSKPGVVCAGILGDRGRLCSLSPALLETTCGFADWTVCEADGANRRPLKLHREGEPVIPKGTDLCLVVAGLSALGKPLSQVIHRYDRNPLWAEHPNRAATWEDLLYCIRENAAVAEMPQDKIYILLNQLDALSEPQQAVAFAHWLEEQGYHCRTGSMASQPDVLVNWILQALDK